MYSCTALGRYMYALILYIHVKEGYVVDLPVRKK